MIKIPPCEKRSGFLVTIGKNGTNSTISRFADFTIGRTPNVAIEIYGYYYSFCFTNTLLLQTSFFGTVSGTSNACVVPVLCVHDQSFKIFNKMF